MGGRLLFPLLLHHLQLSCLLPSLASPFLLSDREAPRLGLCLPSHCPLTCFTICSFPAGIRQAIYFWILYPSWVHWPDFALLCCASATTGQDVPQKQRWHGEAPGLCFGSAPAWQRDEGAHPPHEAVLLLPSQRLGALPATAIAMGVTIQASKSDLKQSKMQTGSRLLWEPPGNAGSSTAPRRGWMFPSSLPAPLHRPSASQQCCLTEGTHTRPPLLTAALTSASFSARSVLERGTNQQK